MRFEVGSSRSLVDRLVRANCGFEAFIKRSRLRSCCPSSRISSPKSAYGAPVSQLTVRAAVTERCTHIEPTPSRSR